MGDGAKGDVRWVGVCLEERSSERFALRNEVPKGLNALRAQNTPSIFCFFGALAALGSVWSRDIVRFVCASLRSHSAPLF